MTRKHHTIIFVPHSRARFRQFRVSSRLLVGSAAFVLLSVAIGVTFAALWVSTFRRNRDFSAVVAENRDLRGRTAQLHEKLERVERSLAEFEERTRRLSIVAGLTSVHDAGTGGVGGLTSLPLDPATASDLAASEVVRRSSLVTSRLLLVEKRLTTQADQLSLTPTLAPVVGALTAGFGGRTDPFTGQQEFHPGLDISTPVGNRVVAPANGTVVRISFENGYGRLLEIAHGFGINTLYAHLHSVRVTEGQRIRRGDLLAVVGTTGRSTGPHLHYEVRVNGKPVNPLDYVLNAY